jgi:arylsulfatase A-like enzyme
MKNISTHTKPVISTPKPNILFILTDQEQNWTWLNKVKFGPAWPTGDLWSGYQQLFPTRYYLMRNGVNFRHHYTTTAPCSPARSVLFTGQHTAKTRVFDNVNLPYGKSMPPYDPSNEQTLKTIAQILTDAYPSYYCAYKGKWHLTEKSDAEELGLNTWKVNGETHFDLQEYGFHDWQGWDIEGMAGDEGSYDPVICDDAIGWISTVGVEQNKQGRPWFFTVSFVNPHDINSYPNAFLANCPQYVTSLPANLKDDLSQKPKVHQAWKETWDFVSGSIEESEDPVISWLNLRNNYIQYQVDVDKQLGKLLNSLFNVGLGDNTIVVFSADHGELGGAHGLRAKGPELYYESRIVPLIILGPTSSNWQRPAGGDFVVSDSLACHLDLAPTFLSWAGLRGADFNLKGHDLTPILEDTSATVRDHVLFTNDMIQVIAVTTDPDRSNDKIFSRGIFGYGDDGRLYKYARYFEPCKQATGPYEYELYDWSTPNGENETENLANDPDYAPIKKEMDAKLDELLVREDERTSPEDCTGKFER